jgi:hypothetical protein
MRREREREREHARGEFEESIYVRMLEREIIDLYFFFFFLKRRV